MGTKLFPHRSDVLRYDLQMFTHGDLFRAFGRAKQHMGLLPGNRIPFANYEAHLDQRLSVLRKRAQRSQWFDEITPMVSAWPKTVSPTSDGTIRIGTPTTELPSAAHIRLVLGTDPALSTMECLWLERFGPALESTLSDSCMGYRLRLDDSTTSLHPTSRHLFQFWPAAFGRFQRDAIDSARKLLRSGSPCTIASFDLSSYYDNIDPRFLISRTFIESVEKSFPSFDKSEYVHATTSLIRMYARFRQCTSSITGRSHDIGVPIGSIIACVVSNVCLSPLDRWIAKRSHYYARYVDDMILVSSGSGLHDLPPVDIAKKLMPTRKPPADGSVVISELVLRRPGCRFLLQEKKLRVFALNGSEGVEYLNEVSTSFRRVQSERRMFLSSAFGSIPSGAILGRNTSHPNTLREIDTLRLERLSASVAMMQVARIIPLLSPEARIKFLKDSLSAAAQCCDDLPNWVDYQVFFFRLLAILVSGGDTESALRMTRIIRDHCRTLSSGDVAILWNNYRVDPIRCGKCLRDTFDAMIRDTIASSIGADTLAFECPEAGSLNANQWRRLATRLARTDLRAFDARSDRALNPDLYARIPSTPRSYVRRYLSHNRRRSFSVFRRLSDNAADHTFDHIGDLSLALMTRPPTQVDISLVGVQDHTFSHAVPVTNAFRGTNYQFNTTLHSPTNEYDISARSPYGDLQIVRKNPRLVVANLHTTDAAFDCALQGLPPHGIRSRVDALTHVLDTIVSDAGDDPERPTLAVLPELSIPRDWRFTIVNYLAKNNVGVVAGIEYAHLGGKRVVNEAIAVIPTGYSTVAACAWSKRFAASHEETLIRSKGLRLVPRSAPYDGGASLKCQFGRLGCLICSEILEVNRVSNLFGRVDVVCVPAWNQDTMSFDHLVQSTAMMLHAYVAVANNSEHSDCRVRSPRKDSWARDDARLILRQRNGMVSAILELQSLTQFHGAGPLGTMVEPEWKPLPPGYPVGR